MHPVIYTRARTPRQTGGPAGQSGPTRQPLRVKEGADRADLDDGEVAGDEVTTVVIPKTRRTRWYHWHDRRSSKSSLPPAMAARRRCSPAGAPLRPWNGTGDGVRAPGRGGEQGACASEGKEEAEAGFPRSGEPRRARPELRRAIGGAVELTA
jgi:hypothetical protein